MKRVTAIAVAGAAILILSIGAFLALSRFLVPTSSDFAAVTGAPSYVAPSPAIEVSPPYLVPHSVTIWSAVAGSRLYVGARDPDTKRWPGWVARDPNVRLKIGEQIYEAELSVLDDPTEIAKVRSVYTAKYDLPDPPPEGAPPLRYWRVEPRG